MSRRAAQRSLVIGEALIDEVCTPGGRVERSPGGSPFNVAIGMARLGIETSLLAHIGDDEDGRLLTSRLGIDGVANIGEPHGVTSVAAAMLANDGSATYDFRVAWDPRPSIDVAAVGWTHVHVGSYAAFAESTRELLARAVAGAARPIVTFDPNIRAGLLGPRPVAARVVHELAAVADIVKLSDEDADWLFPGASADEVADVLLADGTTLVAVTRGATGSLLATSRARVHCDAPTVPVVDTIGAGDSYMSALAAHVLRRRAALEDGDIDDLVAAGGAAHRAAAITVMRSGANPPTLLEVA